MNPLNKLAWMTAIQAKKKEVTIDGITYTIKYNHRPGVVWVQKKDDFFPCGELFVGKVTSGDWFR